MSTNSGAIHYPSTYVLKGKFLLPYLKSKKIPLAGAGDLTTTILPSRGDLTFQKFNEQAICSCGAEDLLKFEAWDES